MAMTRFINHASLIPDRDVPTLPIRRAMRSGFTISGMRSRTDGVGYEGRRHYRCVEFGERTRRGRQQLFGQSLSCRKKSFF